MLDMNMTAIINAITIAAVPAMLGIILHEVAHGWMADRCGDPTARFLGRLTLNPIPHIDPRGLLAFVLTSMSGSFVFGWAKPVPVNTRNFRNPNRDLMLVALAGPVTNFLLAVFFTLLLFLLLRFFPVAEWRSSTYEFLMRMFSAGISINLGLAWLNLLPIPPLDGSKVLAYFMPYSIKYKYLSLERFGFMILLLLIFAGVLRYVIGPLIQTSAAILFTLFGLS